MFLACKGYSLGMTPPPAQSIKTLIICPTNRPNLCIGLLDRHPPLIRVYACPIPLKSAYPLLGGNWFKCDVLYIPKRAQIAAVEWDREAIAPVKAGMSTNDTFRSLENNPLVRIPFSGLA